MTLLTLDLDEVRSLTYARNLQSHSATNAGITLTVQCGPREAEGLRLLISSTERVAASYRGTDPRTVKRREEFARELAGYRALLARVEAGR